MNDKVLKLVNFLMAQIDVVKSPSFVFYSKITFIIISLIFIFGIIILIIKNSWFKNSYAEDLVEFYTYRPYGAKKTFKQWEKIVKKIDGGKDDNYRMAIIEVDALLEETLRGMEYKGEKINDLLNQVDSKIIPNIEKIKSAHEFRNKIVRDPNYELSLDETKKIISIYEQTFRDLQMF